MKTKLLIIGVAFLLLLNGSVEAQTTGTLTFTFNQPKPTSPSVTNNSNIIAVWIESSTGTFIKTKLKHVSNSTADHLPTWAAKSGGIASNAMGANSNTVSADTGATLKNAAVSPSTFINFGLKTITWDGTNVTGGIVLDGAYKIWVESSWNDNGTSLYHNEIISFPFTKGTSTTSSTPTGDGFINTVTLTWTPTQAGIDNFSNKPEVSLYPNPTNGILNMEFKNEVNAIRIINILGKVVYNERVTEDLTNSNKRIDLSNLVGGIYIVSVSNDNGTSNYKVVLNK
jgi:hypothetical protein